MTKILPINRRKLLGFAAASVGLSSVSNVRFAHSALMGDQRLIVVILRGAMDGLAALAPIGDPRYGELRGALALKPDQGLALNDTFALSPALSALKPIWDARELAFMHAVASPYRERSHFEGQAVLETGGPGSAPLRDGWLNRALAEGGPSAPERALAVASMVPLLLAGKVAVSNWAPAGQTLPDDNFLDHVANLYKGAPDLESSLSRGREIHRSIERAGAMDPNAGESGQMAPRKPRQASNFAETARLAADLIKAPGGPQVTVFDLGGFDTHADQGVAEGRLAPRLKDLGDGLAALKDSLGPAWAKTAVICASEFGRTVRVNGTGGSDHGTGGLAMILGGAVRGGRMVGDWPGLGAGALFEDRDLQPANDLRSVFKSALIDHLHLSSTYVNRVVFPDSAGARLIPDLFSV